MLVGAFLLLAYLSFLQILTSGTHLMASIRKDVFHLHYQFIPDFNQFLVITRHKKHNLLIFFVRHPHDLAKFMRLA